MVGLSDGEKNFEDMCNRLDTIPACDGQTSCHGIVRAMHARRAVIRIGTRIRSIDSNGAISNTLELLSA